MTSTRRLTGLLLLLLGLTSGSVAAQEINFSTANFTITEGQPIDFDLTLSAPAPAAGLTPFGDISTSGGNFGINAGTDQVFANFAPGSEAVSATFVTSNDDVDEPDGTVTFTLIGGVPDAGITIGSANTITVTILDDDTAGLSFSTASLTVAEAGSQTYTVVLDSEPTASVTVTPTSGNAAAATVSPATLTFTTSNWDTAQSVTVSGVNDGDQDDESVTISHTASGGGYDDVSGTLTVTIQDDDSPGLSFAAVPTSVTEGSSATYTVQLATRPSSSVIVMPESSNPAAATVSSGLFFTASNWDTAQTLTISGVGDTNIMNETLVISHTATSNNADYNNLTDSITITTIDDDSAISPDAPAAIATFVSEAFGSGVVRVDISWPEPADNGCTIDEYAYTSVGTDPQGIEEGTTSALSYREFYLRSDLPYTVMVHTVSSAVGCTNSAATTLVYSGVAPAAPTGFTGTAGDTQVALFWINPNDPSITRWEYELIADGSGSGIWIEIPGSDANTNSYTVTGLTNGIFHVFRVRAVNPEGISLSSPVVRRIPQVLGSQPRLNFSSTVFSVAQDGTAEYTVQLNTEPSANVTVALESGDTATATVSPTTLTFTTSNRELAQTVTVSGVATGSTNITHTATSDDDDYDNLVRSVQVTTTAAAPNNAPTVDTEIANQTLSVGSTSTVDISATFADSDDDTLTYSVMSDDTAVATVSVTDEIVTVTGEAVGSANISVIADDGNGATVTDTFSVTVNAAPGITFSSSALTVDEGDTTTYTVVLDTAPTDDVTVTPTSGNTDAASVSGALTFTDSNWNTVQTVTVTGVDDDNDDFESDITISHAATSDDSNYTISDAGDVSVTTNDDDVTISVSGPDTIVEGSTATITYTLSAPLAEALGVTDLFNFTDTISAGQTAFSYTVGPFTDDADTVDESFTVRIASIDNPLVTIAIASHTFTIIDDDRDAGVILSATSGSAAEDGGEIEYTVLLDAPPTGSVTITPTSGDDTTADVSGALTFTTSNWFTPQTITVTGVNDDLVNASDRTATISHAASGGGYGSVTVGDFTFTANDDDIPVPGVTLSPTSGAAAEDGGTATYTVVLDTQPSADVTVTPTSGATDVATVSAALTFTTSNFGTAQTVTVTGVNDDLVNASDRTATISHTASGGDYASVTVGDYTFTANDDDDPTPPDAPVLELGSIRSVLNNFTFARLIIPWLAPLSDNGCPISGYEVTVSTGGSVVETLTNDSSEMSVTFTFIKANTPYTVEVQAVSTVCGNRSAPATLFYTDPPAAPTGLSATPGDTEVTLNWNEFGDVGVIAWQFSQDGGGWQGIGGSDATTTSHTVSGLTNNTTYSFRVRTVNVPTNEGVPSAAVTATPQAPPGLRFTPESLSVGEISTATYTVVLASPPDVNVIITLASGNTDAATVSPATLTFSTTDWNTAQSVTVTGVDDTNTASESVTISHSASGGGYDSVTGTVTVTTSDDDILPAQPTGLGGTTTPGVGVTLNWDNPNNASITRWEYEQIANGSGADTWIEISGSDADTTSFTVTGLSIGTAHSFRIRAVNNTGNSPASASATATPLAQTLTLSAAQATITEGGDASLNASIAVPISGPILLDYSVTGAERFIASNQLNQSFFIAATATQSNSLTISTIDDNIDEADASVTVTITGARDLTNNPVAGVPIGSTATFIILDNDTAPVVVNAIADQSVVQGAGVSIDISDTFADQDTLSYTATSGDESIATATVSGTTLTVTGVAVGSTDITLSATDPDDASNNGAETVSDTFSVSVTADLMPTFGSASITAQSYIVGSTITNLVLPEASGGNGTLTYSISPTLPAGLSFNATTRTLSGAPTSAQTATDYTYTVSDADNDSVTLTLSITVTGLTLSLSAITTTTEGRFALFEVTPDSTPAVTLDVHGTVSTSGDFGVSAGPRTIRFNAGVSGGFTAGFPSTDDAVDEPDGSVTFTLTSVTDAFGNPVAGVIIGSPNSVTVTILDDDTAPIVANDIDDQSVEQGTSVSIDISDTFADQDTLSYAATSGDESIATATLSGTTLTVTGVADGSTNITLSATDPDDASNNGAETVSDSFSVSVISPGITFSSSALTVDENDTTTYTVVLNTAPTDDVTVTPESGNTDAATVSGALTFTDSNWDTVQTITVTGVDDTNDDFESDITISHAATSDDSNYTISDAGDVSVTTNDDDVTVSISAAPSSAVEGSPVTFTYTISAPLAEALVVTEALFGFTETILAGQTTVSYTVTYPADPNTVDGFDTQTIRGTDNPLVTIATASITVTIIDLDRDAGVTLSATSGSAAEDGGAIEYTVLLDAPPTGSVTITPTSGDDTTADVSGALTFTTSNWFTPQTVTVTGVDDDLVNASNRTATISHAASGGGYGSVTVGDFTFTATDDDIPVPGVTLSPTSGAAAEDGGTATYTVVLDTQPSGSVTVTPTSGDDTTADVSAALTFTTSNFGTAQTITVTGVDDAIVNASNRTATISHAASGGGYASVTVGDYTFTANDDDDPRPPDAPVLPLFVNFLIADPISPIVLIRWSAPPSDNGCPISRYEVTVSTGGSVVETARSDYSEGMGGSATLSFINANNPYTVEVEAVSTVCGNRSAPATLIYADPPAAPTGLSATPDDGEVTLNWDELGDASVIIWQFSQDNGASWQGIADSDATTTSHTVTGLANSTTYSFRVRTLNITRTAGGASAAVTATPQGPPGLRFSTTSVSVAEAGTATYTVVLTSEPTASVTVTPESGNTDAATVSPATLTFSTTDWNTAQSVTVTGVDDTNTASETVTISHNASGGGYDDVSGTVTVTTSDDDILPAQPTGLGGTAATPGVGAVTLNWDNPNNASITRWEYEQIANGSGSDTWIEILGSDADTTRFTVTGLSIGTAHSFRIRAVNNTGNSPASASATATPLAQTLTLSAAQATITEGGDASLNANIAVPIGGLILLDYSVTGAERFIASNQLNQSFFITPSQTQSHSSLTISTIDDNIDEADASVTVTITGTRDFSDNPVAGVPIGSTATFTILDNDTAPVVVNAIADQSVEQGADVSIDISDTFADQDTLSYAATSGDESIATATVSGTTLTVTGVAVGSTDITLSATDPDDASNNGAETVSDTFSVNVTADLPGVTLSATSGSAGEDGGTATYTVVLNTQPSGSVTVTPTSGDDTTADVSAALTFTTSNFGTAQTITVTGVDDAIVNASNRTATISHAASGGGYASVTVGDYTFTANDDDAPGLSFSPASLTVAEAGSETYTVRLNTAPTDDVTVTPESGNTDAATVSSALTFTDSNWFTPQTITVTGVDDTNDDFETLNITHAATSDDSNYTISDAGDVSVTTSDNDLTLSIVALNSTITEGEAAEFVITLSSSPAVTVSVRACTSQSGNFVNSFADCTDSVFFAKTILVSTNFSISTIDDIVDEADGSVTRTIEISNADLFPPPPGLTITQASATVIVIDDDGAAGATLSSASGSAAEDGGAIEYTVRLDAPPTGSVTITPTSGATDVATVSGALTFSDSNWFTLQTVTVTGVDDDIDNDPDRTATISHAASGGGYASVTVGDYTFTATDDDAVGVTLSATALTVDENDTTTYSVVLDTAPTDDVTVTPESGNTDAATVSSALTFTDSNWDTVQTITVTGVDDTNDDFETLNITHAATSDDSNYTISDAGDVSVTTNDDDVTISISGPDTVVEGSSKRFTHTLSAPLAEALMVVADVGIFTRTIPAGQTTSGRSLTSTDGNDDDELFTVTILSTDNPLVTIAIASHTVTIIDDDRDADVSLSATSGSAAEDGGEIEYTVLLDAPPTGSVTITPTSGDDTTADVSGALTFTTSNWFTPQTVTVTGVNDDIDNNPDRTATISHTVASSDSDYDAISVSDFDFTATDDDIPVPGVTFSSSALTVDEGDTTTYTVVLDTAPTDDVTVTPESGNTDAATVSGALTFTTSNFGTAQTVTVTGVDDTNDDFETLNITHAATSDDSNYTISDAGDVSVTTNDDDVTVSISGPDTVVEGSSITFTYTLSAPLAEALVVTEALFGFTDTILAGQTTVSYTVTYRADPNTVDGFDTQTIRGTDNPLVTIAIASITVTIIDPDRDAGITLSATSGSAAEDGGEIEYTVLLDAPPTGSVTITPTSGDDTAADVSGALTFTTSNWFTPQTITVTGVNDAIVNASNRTATISHAASGGGYGSVTVGDFTFTATDDEIPVPGVTLSATSGNAGEDGGTATYTVVLDTQPSADVTVTPTSGDNTTADVSAALTFTTSNFGTAQTITVTGVNDDLVNASDRTATISHTISGGGYGSVTVGTFTFTATDDDIPGLSFSTASLTVAEAGSETYTVRLNTAPTADVTVTPTSGNTDAATVSGALTFTDSNWATVQSVTVTGVDDDNGTDETFNIIHLLSSTDTDYSTVTGSVGVTTTDDDTAAVTLSPTGGSATEDGDTAIYNVVLDTQPSGNVTVTPTSGNADAATVSGALTFTMTNWDTAQTVTVTGVDDDIDNASNRTATISHAATSSDGDYSGITIETYMFTATDDDTAAVTLSATSGNASEDGGTATYTVVLDTQPTGSVTITPTSGDDTTADVSAALTFTTSNFGTAQTVTVTGVDDAIQNSSNRTATISHTASGGDYNSVTVGTFTFTATDDDTAGLRFTPDSLTVAEAGTATYTVRLNTAPTDDVTVTPTSGDPDAATVSGALTFTDSNWATAQTITVTGVDDANSASETFDISHTATGGGYDAVTGTVGVTTTDDDAPGLSFTPDSVSVAEAGSETYTVVLDTAPTDDVTVTPTSGNTDAATVSSALTFTTSNFGTAQTITVTGVDDDNGTDETFNITHAASGGGYGSVTGSVAVTTTDDDTPGLSFTPDSVSVGEAGSETYTVVLDTQPSGEVILFPTSSNAGAATVRPTMLTFTTSNWDTVQTITVTGVDDGNATDETFNIMHRAIGGGYDSVNATVAVTTDDDDTAGVTVTPPMFTVAEAGSTTYTVVLDSQPTASVTITPASGDTGVVTVSDALIFTTANWDTAQPVTVSGEDDADTLDETVTISHSASSSDSDYSGLTVDTVSVTTDDDDSPNNAPTVASEIANQNVTVDNRITVNVSTTFTDSDNDALSYSVMSDDDTTASVSVSGNVVSVTGVAAGSADISVTADDGNGGSISDTFMVSVTAAATNNAPTVVTEIANQNVTVGNRITVNVSSTFTDSDNDALSYSVMSDDTAVATVSVIGNTVTVTGVAAGSADISVTASDPDGESVTDIFSVSVAAAATNNAPTVVTAIADQTVTVNAMTSMDVSTTFTDSDNDALTYSASSNNTNIATVTVSGNTVTVTGVAAGSTTISVTASDPDGESVTDIFSVSVSVTAAATNNAPTVATEIADQTVTVNAMTSMDVSSTFTDSDNDTLTYSAMSDDTNIATVTVSGSVVSVSGVAAGSTTISVTASDPDGESVTDIFSVSVTAAATNNAPTVVTEIADQTVTVNAMTSMDVSTTFTDSDNDTLSYSASSNDTNIATVTVSGSVVSVSGVAAGSTTISVTANDGNGGMVSDIFAVTVDTMPTNNAPTVVNRITDQMVTAGNRISVDVSSIFADSDNDTLSYSASSNNTNIATVTVSGSVVSVTGIAAGSTTISVTANDGNGGMVSDIFAVTTTGDAAIMSIGELNETVLPEVTLAIVRHTQGVVARRVGQIASGAGAAAKVLTIAGQSSLGAALSTHADAINAGVLSLKDVLGNSDFVLPLNASSSGGPAARTSVSLWGGGEYRSLSDDDSVFDWDGDLFSASLGIDANLRNNILLGVAGSWSDADVDYRQENQSNEGDYTLSLFSVHPYAGWTGKRLSWWLTGGYGYGELSVGDDVNENSSDVSLLSFGTGASGVLWTGDISTLRLKGDFLWAEMDVEGGDGISPYTTDVNGSRLLLEASQVHSLNGGISLEPSLELGVRYDGGDGDDRTNMELGAGLRLRGNRLTLDGSVYALLGGDDFEDWNIREWGVRGLLHLQGGRYGRGLSFSLTPGYGTPERDAEALLWNDGHTNNLVNTQADQDGYGMRWDTELGYGILAGQGMLTPYGQMTLSDGSKRYRLGLRWSQTELFELELEGERRQRDSQGHGQGHGDDVDNAILLQGRLRF